MASDDDSEAVMLRAFLIAIAIAAWCGGCYSDACLSQKLAHIESEEQALFLHPTEQNAEDLPFSSQ
jgi:hypothetical protein